MCEMVIQVGAAVLGNDALVTFSGTFRPPLELNTQCGPWPPHLLHPLICSRAPAGCLARRCNHVKSLMQEYSVILNIENILAMGTSLAPVNCYDKAAKIGKDCLRHCRTVREVALEISGLANRD